MPKATPTSLTVTPETAGQRLDVFLAAELGVSRSQVQKMIDEKRVLINGKLPRKAGDTLSVGGIITITKIAPLKTVAAAPEKNLPKPAGELAIEIIAETPDYIVINKPNGLLTDITMANEKNSVATILS